MSDGQRAGQPVLLLAAGLAIGLALAAAPTGGLRAGLLAAALAGSLLVAVPVPGGGSVPIGFALAMAIPALLPLDEAATVAVAGSLLAAAVSGARDGGRAALAVSGRLLLATTVPVGAVAAMLLAVDASPIERVAVAAATLVATEAVLIRLARLGRHVIDLRSAAWVYATITSGGVLLAVATDQVGVAMATVASAPLLIARFSFQRYAAATDTLAQTVQALGLVPELAALAPLGHSERCAVYAAAIADELGFERMSRTRVISAARLHHLGAVPFDPTDNGGAASTPQADDVARQGATILREAGFPSDVADLIETARAGSLDGPASSIEAAVVRVATAFDEIVGDDHQATDRALAILGGAVQDQHTRRALAALLRLAVDHPQLIEEAISSGDRFREAAADLDLDALVAAGGAEVLPFVRRRA